MTPATLIPLLVLTVLVLFVALVAVWLHARRKINNLRHDTERAHGAANHWFFEHQAVAARLAKFTGPRERDAKGLFVSTKVAA